MAFKIRRIVTGHDAAGKSVVTSDEIIESRAGRRGPQTQVANLWMTAGIPPELAGPDPRGGGIPMLPGKKGTIFRFMEIGPRSQPHMHRTETLDYIVVMEGELDMYMDDGRKVHMMEGEVMIQRATLHGWANPSEKPCRFATVILDAGGRLFE